MIKAAFFDIDGTLLSFKTHRIPASAQQVLDSFHEQGIACVIATGRPTYQIPDWLFDLGWDAYITLSGQHCFDAKGVYRSCPIDPDDVAAIVDQVAQGRYDSLCMQGENSFVNRLSERVVTAGSNAGIVYHEEPFEHAFDAPVYQFCAFVDPADEHIVTDAVSHSLTTRWCDLFCDIIPANGGKDLGVAATLERLGIDASEAIAFGDGENDLSMFSAVGTSGHGQHAGHGESCSDLCDDCRGRRRHLQRCEALWTRVAAGRHLAPGDIPCGASPFCFRPARFVKRG